MPIQSDNTLSNLLDLYTKAKGSTTTSTTGSNISKEGVDGLIQQILSSSQGLAAVSSGQKAAGLYNSSANSMLTNDLLTQTAGKVAALQAGTTTKTKTGGVAGKDVATGLLLAAGKSLLGPTVSGIGKKIGGKFGIDSNKSIGDQVADMLGVGSDSGASSSSIGGSVDLGTDVSDFSAMDFGGGDVAANAGDFTDVMGDWGTSDTAGDVVSSAADDTTGDVLGSLFG